jgi:isoquinoline 1-oxidoreductase alpha subunit
MHTFQLNGQSVSVDVEPDMPLLWVLRDELGHTGTKFGCGVAACGACTVHVDGAALRSCVMPVVAVAGKSVHTIERQDPQCGYCQSGMLMAASALLRSKPQPSDDDIDAAMTNICRCGTYQRVRAAIHTAASKGGVA